MTERILDRVDQRLNAYADEHRGQRPLYIIISPDDADELLKAVKIKKGYEQQIVDTAYRGSKIVPYDGLKRGELELSDELPSVGS